MLLWLLLVEVLPLSCSFVGCGIGFEEEAGGVVDGFPLACLREPISRATNATRGGVNAKRSWDAQGIG